MVPDRDQPELENVHAAGTSRHRCSPDRLPALRALLARFGIDVHLYPAGVPLPGSYWGEPEAGIVGLNLHVRPDTPIHSALHEACHLVCMDPGLRAAVHTDAGGNDLEESAVCRLQILLADHLPGVGRDALMADMDAWGYSFRLGSTRAWFLHDSEDADAWLRTQGLVDSRGAVTFRLRGDHGH
jgi:hypothetical protein